VLRFKSWRKSPALTQETTPSQRRITRMLSEAQQAAAREFDTHLPRVAELLSRGRVNEVTNLLPMDPWVDVQEPLAYELLGELLDAGSRVRLPTIEKATLEFSFDRGRPESAAWAWQESGRLIVGITQEQRDVVRTVVTQAVTGAPGWMGTMTGGPDWTGVSRQVRNTIGLTAQQAGWVTNHYDRAYTSALSSGASLSQAATLAQRSAHRYQTSVHRYRANTIARTETMRAASEGRQQAWNQGMTEGFIDSLWQKEWIAESDACEVCQAIDGQRVGVKDSFSVGEPPAHPNCRCDVLLVPPKAQPQRPEESPFAALPFEQLLPAGVIPGAAATPLSLPSVPVPSKPEPTFIGLPSGVFIGMPKVVTFASILEQADDLVEAAAARGSTTDADPLLRQLYQVRGYDGLPTVLDDDAFEALIDYSVTRPMYRGMVDRSGDAADNLFLQAFRTGDYFPGEGVFGNGTYAADNFAVARGFGGGISDNVIRMVLAPGSNTVSHADIKREWLAFTRSEEYDRMTYAQRRLLDDLGRYAVMRGYDSIFIEENGYHVILNRSRLTVASTNGMGPRVIYEEDLDRLYGNVMAFDEAARDKYPRGQIGMDMWAWDQGYRYIHTRFGDIVPIDDPALVPA